MIYCHGESCCAAAGWKWQHLGIVKHAQSRRQAHETDKERGQSSRGQGSEGKNNQAEVLVKG